VGQIDNAYDSQDKGHGEGNDSIKTGSLDTFDKHMGLPNSQNNGQGYTDDGNLVAGLFQLTQWVHDGFMDSSIGSDNYFSALTLPPRETVS
jgi:hypothetical protein